HLVTSEADNFFGVIGPTPIELLANDYRAIYTWPQTTKNQAELIALNGRYSVTDHWTVQSNLYYRRFDQQHVEGNAAEVERCSGAASNPLFKHPVPRKRCLPAAATAGGRLPDPQSEWPTDQLSAGWWQYLRDHALGHRRPHLHQGADDRRLVAGPQRRQGARSRQLLRHRRQRRSQQDRLQGQQRAWLYLSRSLRGSQRRCAGDGRDHSHRGQSRL